jgi:hypothetical protein
LIEKVSLAAVGRENSFVAEDAIPLGVEILARAAMMYPGSPWSEESISTFVGTGIRQGGP